ncbi:MAG: hypothetical protein HC904_09850 [Blastochloris sp.]|nr:hypothetical protein [Blastochloris sp.]
MNSSAQRRALESLLADEDFSTRQLVIEELRSGKAKNHKLVEDLARSVHPQVALQAQSILSDWQGLEGGTVSASGNCQGLQGLTPACLKDWVQLESLCWLLVQTEYRDYEVKTGTQILDALARKVLQRYQAFEGQKMGKWRALHEVLGVEEGYVGDTEEYYSPDNSYLNRVLERKTGIPLTLALTYVFVGLRLRWNVSGVNTPGHYLAAVEGTIFDPFFGGMALTPKMLKERFGDSCLESGASHYFSATPFETAQRMMSNLMNSYARNGDDERLRRVGTYLQILQEKQH